MSGIGVACAAVAVQAGCGAGGEEEVSGTASRAELPVMVLPKAELGRLAERLVVEGTSGWTDNREAAADTLDRKDTARTLALSGRVKGYELAYGPPDGMKPPAPGRTVSMSTEVELFRDERSASAYLRKRIAEIQAARGRRLDNGFTVAAPRRFEVDDVGDEAAGVTAILALDNRDVSVFTTIVAIRRGRVVASAAVGQLQDLEVEEDMTEIARSLDERVKGVMAGTFDATPVKLPKRPWWESAPDPRRLALRAGELGLRMRL
jgi:hypothetical protein